MDQADVVENQVEVKTEESGQRCRAAHTQDVDAPGAEDQIDSPVKRLAVNPFQGALELVHIRMQDSPEDVFMYCQLGRGAQSLD